jgi:hypothetical protein
MAITKYGPFQSDDEERIIKMILKLYDGAIRFTHSNEGERDHRDGYRKLDEGAHDIAFWLDGEEGLERFLRRG